MNKAERKRLQAELAAMGLTEREQQAALDVLAVLKPMPAQKRLNVIKRVQARLAEDPKGEVSQ